MIFSIHAGFVDRWALCIREGTNLILGAFRLETFAGVRALGLCTVSVDFSETFFKSILDEGNRRASFTLAERIEILLSSFASNDGLTIRVVAALIHACHLGTGRCPSIVTATAVVGHAKGVI